MKLRLFVGVLALLASWGFALWAAPQLPDVVVTHWGASGEPNGWSSKALVVWWLPLVYLGLALLLAVLPRIDPRRRHVAHNAPTYWFLTTTILVVLALIHVAMVAYNLGWPVRIENLVPLVVGGLFVVIGNLMPRMRPNWFMGIRTPWTLSSERVWRRTHRLGGVCMIVAGLAIAAMGLGWRPDRVGWLIGAALTAVLIPVVYSYFAWRTEREAPASGTKGEDES